MVGKHIAVVIIIRTLKETITIVSVKKHRHHKQQPLILQSKQLLHSTHPNPRRQQQAHQKQPQLHSVHRTPHLKTRQGRHHSMSDLRLAVDSAVSDGLQGNLPDMKAFQKGKFANKPEAIVLDEKYLHLFEVEKYLQTKSKIKLQKAGIELAYDVTAIEPLFFKTINYTTYAGMVVLHPLNFELSMRQIYEAHSDGVGKKHRHIDHIRQQISEGNFSKYRFSQQKKAQAKKALVVLAGANKLKKHCCVGKMETVLNKFGRDNVLFKKHPISHDDIYCELSEYLGGIHFADAHSNLYDLMCNSEYILSSFISESALVAKLLGKTVDHMDLWQNRETTSFGHINYFLFSMSDELNWLDQAFASYKSGVISPLVDADWKQKIDAYVDFIIQVRKNYKSGYLR